MISLINAPVASLARLIDMSRAWVNDSARHGRR
jgi:hypothetical protein